jgi:DNA-binding GntR family transcriptional regulator
MLDQEPLARRTTSRVVAERLREDILRGEIAPGSRLRQDELAERFRISTTPVREALALLAAEGLIKVDPHRGAIVLRLTAEEVRENYEIRAVLEPLALVKAIPNLTSELLEEIDGILAEMKATKGERWLELNNTFHNKLYEPAGRRRLSSLIASLRDASAAYLYMVLTSEFPLDEADHQHHAIVEACRDRDPERATKILLDHLELALEQILRLFDTNRDLELMRGEAEGTAPELDRNSEGGPGEKSRRSSGNHGSPVFAEEGRPK